VQALSKVFKGKFMQALRQAEQDGTLARDPAATPAQRQQRTQALRQHDWVVYAKTPLDSPAAVLDYLSRYTHRTAIGHERLVGIRDDKVLLRVRAHPHNNTGGQRVIAMDGVQFIARLMQHVLPSGFKRIRHCGLLAPAHKAQRLAAARRLLAMPQANPVAIEQAQAFMRRVAGIQIERCPHCQLGRWRVVEDVLPDRVAWAALWPLGRRGVQATAQAARARAPP
jgi:Putative transposase